MASEAGNETGNLADPLAALSDHIKSLDFISAIRMIESRFPEKPKLGQSARVSDDMVRLSQYVTLSFNGPSLHSFEKTKGQHGYRLQCNFFGLLGTNGPLPLHYTDFADQRARHNSDPTFREFLDLFNHRMLSLFYRASANYEPAINLDRDHNNFDVFIGALGGHMHESGHSRDAIPDHFKRYQAMSFGSIARSPEVLEKLIVEYFDVQAKVSEFVGGWLRLPRDARMSLGDRGASTELGVSTYLGKKVWSIAHRFRLGIGPLAWADYLSFKPGGKRIKSLYDLIRNYTGDEWDWDVQLTTHSEEVEPFSLDRKRSLGFDSWLTGSDTSQSTDRFVLLSKNRIESAVPIDHELQRADRKLISGTIT
ncbi:MAG: type VI secretion system baseplate subunit TssG [Granulosicoccus sp.]